MTEGEGRSLMAVCSRKSMVSTRSSLLSIASRACLASDVKSVAEAVNGDDDDDVMGCKLDVKKRKTIE